MTPGPPRRPAHWLTRFVDPRYAAVMVVLLIVTPVVVNLLRAPQYETKLEIFPTLPPGNAGNINGQDLALGGLVSNAGFQAGVEGWTAGPAFRLTRAAAVAHSGTGSLLTTRGPLAAFDPQAASSVLRLPAAGTYRVEAWVRLPAGYGGGAPRIEIVGLAARRRVGRREGDARVGDRWQLISSEHVVDGPDLDGRIVLRTGDRLPERGEALHWDDVRVLTTGDAPLPPQVNLVPNAGFEYDRSGWGAAGIANQRSEALAHGGDASLRTSGGPRPPSDTNAGYANVVFPRAGTYVAQGWAYLPKGTRAARPGVFLEGFAGSRQLVQRLGDPARRDTWQPVSTEYAINDDDLEGSFVLRNLPLGSSPSGAAPRDGAPAVVFWDDVGVPAPRPEPPADASGPARDLRALIADPQLRLDVSRLADDDLFDPRRTTVGRSSRPGALSFIVSVANDVPGDARDLAGPLRTALVRASRRAQTTRAREELQALIALVGEGLAPEQRRLLQGRANVLQRTIGPRADDIVAPEVPAAAQPAPTLELRAMQARLQRDRQAVVSRLGSGLPPGQRALVERRADDLRRSSDARTPAFVVLPSGPVPGPTRVVDRLLDELPGPLPPRVDPVWAAMAGLGCALLALGFLVAMRAVRRVPVAGA